MEVDRKTDARCNIQQISSFHEPGDKQGSAYLRAHLLAVIKHFMLMQVILNDLPKKCRGFLNGVSGKLNFTQVSIHTRVNEGAPKLGFAVGLTKHLRKKLERTLKNGFTGKMRGVWRRRLRSDSLACGWEGWIAEYTSLPMKIQLRHSSR